LNGEKAAFGSLLQIGFAFAIGIALAVIICGPVSIKHPWSIEIGLFGLIYWLGLRWSLKSGYHNMFCHVQRISLEEGSALYIFTDLWRFLRGYDDYDTVLGTNADA
jgi:hypothetical protein